MKKFYFVQFKSVALLLLLTWIVRELASFIGGFDYIALLCCFRKLRILGNNCNTIIEYPFTAWAILLISKSGALLF